MGVDRPRGRAPFGSGGVAGTASWVRRALTASQREERVDVPSALSVPELARRLDARMDGGLEWHGRGISVRREPSFRYRLTPRSRQQQSGRPQAFVQVVPSGDGARITGVIRNKRPNPVLSALGVPVLVAVLVYWASVAGPGLVVFGLVFVAASHAAERVFGHVQRQRLREFLDEVVAP